MVEELPSHDHRVQATVTNPIARAIREQRFELVFMMCRYSGWHSGFHSGRVRGIPKGCYSLISEAEQQAEIIQGWKRAAGTQSRRLVEAVPLERNVEDDVPLDERGPESADCFLGRGIGEVVAGTARATRGRGCRSVRRR